MSYICRKGYTPMELYTDTRRHVDYICIGGVYKSLTKVEFVPRLLLVNA